MTDSNCTSLNSKQASEYLDQLAMFGIKLGLEQTSELFTCLPQNTKPRYLHIAGTNGKGSTGAQIEAALRGVGFKTGFYSSPHLVDVRERFRVDGKVVSEKTFLENFSLVKAKSDQMWAEDKKPTFFEFTTTLAAAIFIDSECDFVIWETGMGGRYDATNVIDPELSIITNIALDHEEYLGDSLAKIATEKAGIIKHNKPVFTGFLHAEAELVVESKAKEMNSPIYPCDKSEITNIEYGKDDSGLYQTFEHKARQVKLHLLGAMQRENFRLAYTVITELSKKYNFDLNKAIDYLSKAKWPGRCHMLNERLIVDGGHNINGISALVAAIKETFPDEKFSIIFAGFKDKRVKESIEELSQIASSFAFCPIKNPRPSWENRELAQIAKNIAPNIPCSLFESSSEALNMEQKKSPRILVSGSLFLAGEIFSLTDANLALDLV